MARYVIPIVIACVYVAGAAWVVRNEGRSYRDSLRPAEPEPAAPPKAPTRSVDVEKTEEAAPSPVSPRPARPAAKPASTAEIRPEPEKTPTSTAPPPVTPTPATAPAAKEAPPDAVGMLVNRVGQWRKDPFWSQPDLVKSWDLDRFTLQQEKQLGAQLNGLILQFNPEDPGPGLRRVREVASRLLKVVDSKEQEYKFFVLDSDVANVFSHPGGYVYVSRKLLEMIPEDEPAPLEFVLAHEIAHVERHHALACLNTTDVRSFSDGTLQKLYFLIIPHGYPDAFEYQADEWAYNKVQQLHRSEHDCLKFLRILDSYAKANGFQHGRGKLEDLLKKQEGDPAKGREVSPIENHLRSHPAAYERLAHLKELNAPRR